MFYAWTQRKSNGLTFWCVFEAEFGKSQRSIAWSNSDLRSETVTLWHSSSITAFWNLNKASHLKFTISNWMKGTYSYANFDQHWLTEEVQFCFMAILCHILPWWYYRSSPTWQTRYYYIYHIPLISLPLPSTFPRLLSSLYVKRTLLINYDDEITFKAFLEFKSLEIYHKGITNILIRWQ